MRLTEDIVGIFRRSSKIAETSLSPTIPITIHNLLYDILLSCLTIDLIACGLCPVSQITIGDEEICSHRPLKDVFSTTRSKPALKKPHLHPTRSRNCSMAVHTVSVFSC